MCTLCVVLLSLGEGKARDSSQLGKCEREGHVVERFLMNERMVKVAECVISHKWCSVDTHEVLVIVVFFRRDRVSRKLRLRGSMWPLAEKIPIFGVLCHTV